MPWGMWLLFQNSFRLKLTTELSYDKSTSHVICKKANAKYKEIIGRLPEFEKKDRFKMNIVSCTMLSAFILSMPKKHMRKFRSYIINNAYGRRYAEKYS